MLRTNLSTRPFYNERLVYAVLAVAAALVLALTAFNMVRLSRLTSEQALLTESIRSAEREVRQTEDQARRARTAVDRKQLEKVVAAAREANDLIDQRTFSWTGLLNRLETTLPADVRIQSIKPVPDARGGLDVAMVVLSRRPEDIETFVDRLESGAGFSETVSLAESTTTDGLLEVTLQGRYMPGSKPRPAAGGEER